MWWMHRFAVPERLPPGRVVVEFVHTAPAAHTIWMVIDRGEVSVCMQHPGYDSDLVVTCPTPVLSGVFSGVDSWAHEVADGTISSRARRAWPRPSRRGSSGACSAPRCAPPKPAPRPRPDRHPPTLARSGQPVAAVGKSWRIRPP